MGTLHGNANTEMAVGLGLPQEEDLRRATQVPNVFERLQGAVSSMVEYVGDSIPRPTLGVTSRLTAGMLAIMGTGALTPTAGAKIVEGQSIAGVRLGETEAQVMKQLGVPTREQPADPEGNVTWNYGKRPLLGAVTFAANGTLTGMFTSSRQQKTGRGIGTGSSLAQVRKAYPNAKFSTGPFGPKSLIVTVKSRFEGRVVETTFPFFTRSAGVREVDEDFA